MLNPQILINPITMYLFYNMSSLHWTLAVISPWNGLVYWLDPLGAENEINSFAQKIINEYVLLKYSLG